MSEQSAHEMSALTVWQLARPGSLWITVLACLLGFASAAGCGYDPDWASALATLMLAVSFHAGANMLQEDASAPGSAALKSSLSSFTGGHGLVPLGLVSAGDALQLAWIVLGLTMLCGVLLALKAAGGLVGLGLAGLLLAWAYARPPLQLARRGFGELLAALAWWLVVLGADYVWRRHFFLIPAVTAVSFAVLVANVHLASACVTAAADRTVGRHTLAVRWGLPGATAVYWALLILAYGWLVGGVRALYHPGPALWGLASLPLSMLAGGLLWRFGKQPKRLDWVLWLSVLAAALHALSMGAGLFAMILM